MFFPANYDVDGVFAENAFRERHVYAELYISWSSFSSRRFEDEERRLGSKQWMRVSDVDRAYLRIDVVFPVVARVVRYLKFIEATVCDEVYFIA